MNNDTKLLQEAYQTIIEANTQKSILLYTSIYQVNDDFSKMESPNFKEFPINGMSSILKIVSQWKQKGVLPTIGGLAIEVHGKDIPKLLCMHTYFCFAERTNRQYYDIYIKYKKQANEIFLENTEFDPDEFGIQNEKIIDKIFDKINKDDSIVISVAEILPYMKLTNNHSMFGSYVNDIKPNEIIDICICPTGHFEKSKSLLK